MAKKLTATTYLTIEVRVPENWDDEKIEQKLSEMIRVGVSSNHPDVEVTDSSIGELEIDWEDESDEYDDPYN